jgi:hypothetical protein
VPSNANIDSIYSKVSSDKPAVLNAAETDSRR